MSERLKGFLMETGHDKGQAELALDGPFSRERSLALDRAVAADDAKKAGALQRRANAVSKSLVDCLNRRDAVRLELQHRAVEPARRDELEAKLDRYQDDQDEFEKQLTRLAALLGT